MCRGEPDRPNETPRADERPGLAEPRADERPGFAEPWQAQLLAMVDQLSRRGVFTAAAWSEALGAALRRAADSGAPDTPDTYYGAVLETLESLLAAGGAVTTGSLAERREAWRRAYLATPHGQPVELRRD